MNASEPQFTTSLGLVRWIGWAQMEPGEDWIRERELSHPQPLCWAISPRTPARSNEISRS